MEKTCEFCTTPRPVVYCQADTAFLCLACDAKVHSANALSGRHSRILVCDSCGAQPAFVRCSDHSMLLCRGCDSRLHEFRSPHRKQTMSSFTGCPSAMHFAALWGINVNEVGQDSGSVQLGSKSYVSSGKLKSLGSEVKLTTSVSGSEVDSVRQEHQTLNSNQQEHNNALIKQQIIDLKNLQLSEGDNQSSFVRHPGESMKSSSMNSASENLDQPLLDQKSIEVDSVTNDLQNFHSPSTEESKGDHFPAAVSQLDHIPSNFSVGDHIWQFKNSLDDSQFWSQHLQDLGVCEDLELPEMDVTFRNFDDLLTSDLDLTRALLEDSDVEFSNVESFAKEDVSAATSMSKNAFNIEENPFGHSIPQRLARSFECSPHLIRSSFSASVSLSRLSVKSSGSDCLDSGRSREVPEPNCGERSSKESKEMKKDRLHKRSQLTSCKAKGETHKRSKSRILNSEGYESDTMSVSKSY